MIQVHAFRREGQLWAVKENIISGKQRGEKNQCLGRPVDSVHKMQVDRRGV